MVFKSKYLQSVYDKTVEKNPVQLEFIQAVGEVLESLEPVVEKNPILEQMNIIERLVMPERVVLFRVTWVDDSGKVRVNKGFRVQFNCYRTL